MPLLIAEISRLGPSSFNRLAALSAKWIG